MPEAELYRHANGGIYEKVGEATHTSTDDVMIVFKAMVGGRMYVMPAREFEGIVMQDGLKKPHFTPLKGEAERAKEKGAKK